MSQEPWVIQRPLPDLLWPAETHVGMVLVQPQVKLLTSQAGFCLSPASQARQWKIVEEALAIAAARQATFIVFPEYSVPAGRWQEIGPLLEKMPNDCVLIAGLDALRLEQYELLKQAATPCPQGAPTDSAGATWANCCVVYSKGANGKVDLSVQPKLFPAEPEGALAGMLHGQRLHLFESANCRFAVLVCYDLIYRLSNGQELARWLPTQLRQKSSPLDMLFVIQNNDKPDQGLFEQATLEILRSKQVHAVVAVNVTKPGVTALYFPDACKESPVALSTDCLESFSAGSRAVFRNRGDAVFSFDYYPRDRNRAVLPLLEAREHPVDEAQTRQISGVAVRPWTWILPIIGQEGTPAKDPQHLANAATQQQYELNFGAIQQHMLSLEEHRLDELRNLLFVVQTGRSDDPGPEPAHWKDYHRSAVGKLMRAVAAVRFGGNVDLSVDHPAVTAATTWGMRRPVAVVAGGGDQMLATTVEEYSGLAKRSKGQSPADVMVLVLSHRDNFPSDRPVPITALTHSQHMLKRHPQMTVVDAANPAGVTGFRLNDVQPGETALLTYSLPALESKLNICVGVAHATAQIQGVFA